MSQITLYLDDATQQEQAAQANGIQEPLGDLIQPLRP